MEGQTFAPTTSIGKAERRAQFLERVAFLNRVLLGIDYNVVMVRLGILPSMEDPRAKVARMVMSGRHDDEDVLRLLERIPPMLANELINVA